MQPTPVHAFRPVLAGLGALLIAALASADAPAQSLSGSQGATAMPGGGLGLVAPGAGFGPSPTAPVHIAAQCPGRPAARASAG